MWQCVTSIETTLPHPLTTIVDISWGRRGLTIGAAWTGGGLISLKLFLMICNICGATGDVAHTLRLFAALICSVIFCLPGILPWTVMVPSATEQVCRSSKREEMQLVGIWNCQTAWEPYCPTTLLLYSAWRASSLLGRLRRQYGTEPKKRRHFARKGRLS